MDNTGMTLHWPPSPTICFGWATPATQLSCLHSYWPIPHARYKTDAPDTTTRPPAPHLLTAPQRFSQARRPDLPPSSFSSSAARLAVSLSVWGDICKVTTAGICINVPQTGGVYRLCACKYVHKKKTYKMQQISLRQIQTYTHKRMTPRVHLQTHIHRWGSGPSSDRAVTWQPSSC